MKLLQQRHYAVSKEDNSFKALHALCVRELTSEHNQNVRSGLQGRWPRQLMHFKLQMQEANKYVIFSN